VKRLAGVAVALTLVCGACDGSKAVAPSGPTSSASQPTVNQWLGHYALWVTNLRVALLHRDRDALADCGGALEEKLGAVPPPLRKAKQILELACKRFAEGAALDDDHDAFREWSHAARLVRDANGRLATPQPLERLPLPVGRGLLQTSRVEPVFTRIAHDIVPSATEVRCWSRWDWLDLQRQTFGKELDLAGFASTDFKRVNLAWDICDGLATLAYTDRLPGGDEQLRVAFAVTTLMHEAGHLNEVGDFYGAGSNEPLAECWGMQHIRMAARMLGASRAYADELAERYWSDLYPMRPRDYRSDKCRNGGAYDLRPESSVWP
jgi:hypothetical protein